MESFSIKKKVYYHDTDCAGVVYYANYLKYFEEARTEFLAKKGINLKELQESGIFLAVRKVEVKFKNPSRYGELLDIFTELPEIRNASLNFYQYVKKQNKILVEAVTQLVCINKEFSCQPIPCELLLALKKLITD